MCVFVFESVSTIVLELWLSVRYIQTGDARREFSPISSSSVVSGIESSGTSRCASVAKHMKAAWWGGGRGVESVCIWSVSPTQGHTERESERREGGRQKHTPRIGTFAFA